MEDMVSSSEESFSSDDTSEKKGRLDLSWSELSGWPQVIIDSSETHILSLKLHHNFFKEIPMQIQDVSHLVHLDISNNQLNTIPEAFLNLKKLRQLVAKNNLFDDASLPKDFGLMENLRIVNLAGNAFETLPPQICELKKIKSLFFGQNYIHSLPLCIANMTRLEILYLGGNRLEHVPATLGKLINLRILSLCNNKLVSIPSTLASLHRLKSLSLHGNQLTTLPQDIISLDLHELSLRDNPLVNRFVSNLTFGPPSLLELAGRVTKIIKMPYDEATLPRNLVQYLDSAKRCVNPRCAGVYFTARVEQVNFVDFCGKYRLPLLQYLCSPKCTDPNSPAVQDADTMAASLDQSASKLAKVLLG